MSSGKMVLGVLAGVALGTVVGMLLAPAKGVETRMNIRTSGNDFFGNFKNKYNHFIDEITSKLDAVAQSDGAETVHPEINHDHTTSSSVL